MIASERVVRTCPGWIKRNVRGRENVGPIASTLRQN